MEKYPVKINKKEKKKLQADVGRRGAAKTSEESTGAKLRK